MLIQYVLVVATCTQHLSVLGSDQNISSTNVTSTQKLEEQATGNEFSLSEFSNYVRQILVEAEKFQRMHVLLDNLSNPEFAIDHPLQSEYTLARSSKSKSAFGRLFESIFLEKQNYESILDELIAAKGQFPRFAKSGEPLLSATDNLATEKMALLQRVKDRKKLRCNEDFVFVGEWVMNSLNEARSAVQSNFLNGKPDPVTVALFMDLQPKHLNAVKKFFSENLFYMLGEICERISNIYFEDANYLSPNTHSQSPGPFPTKWYKCRIGSNQELKRELTEVGTCQGFRTSRLIYFKVAVAQVLSIDPNDPPCGINYFIAFDKITKDPAKDQSWLTDTFVAHSFFQTYEEPKPLGKILPSRTTERERKTLK